MPAIRQEPDGFIAKIKHRLKQAEANLYSYGPPYKEDYGGNLCEDCNKKNPSLMDIHSLLKDGGDPRVPNTADNSNTPLHYAARYCQLNLAKMLIRATAPESETLKFINQTNEQGISPLAMCCAFPQPFTRKDRHLAMVKWFVNEGAKINTIDKGGQTPLHFAAFSGRMHVCMLLVNSGAVVTRELEFLSLKNETPVDAAKSAWPHTDGHAKVERILELKATVENNTRAAIKEEAEKQRRIAELNEMQRKRKEARAAQKRQESQERLARRAAMNAYDPENDPTVAKKKESVKPATVKKEQPGIWKRRQDMVWQFQVGVSEGKAASTSILDEAIALKNDLSGTENRRKLRKRWKKMTGTRLIDLDMNGNEINPPSKPTDLALPAIESKGAESPA